MYKQQKLGLTEFSETFFENLDDLVITNQSHIVQNEEFYNEICFKCFDIYQRESSDFSVNDILKFVHVFLYATFKHKPSVDKDDDEIILK